jgi:hypothetical protein
VKKQGIYQGLGSTGAINCELSSTIKGFFLEFPAQTNREFLCSNRESHLGLQGIKSGKQRRVESFTRQNVPVPLRPSRFGDSGSSDLGRETSSRHESPEQFLCSPALAPGTLLIGRSAAVETVRILASAAKPLAALTGQNSLTALAARESSPRLELIKQYGPKETDRSPSTTN